jgi:hypothetical protein
MVDSATSIAAVGRCGGLVSEVLVAPCLHQLEVEIAEVPEETVCLLQHAGVIVAFKLRVDRVTCRESS